MDQEAMGRMVVNGHDVTDETDHIGKIIQRIRRDQYWPDIDGRRFYLAPRNRVKGVMEVKEPTKFTRFKVSSILKAGL